MFEGQRRFFRFYFIFFSFLLVMGGGRSYAGEIVAFGPQDARIEGSIKYSLIGKYIARFDHFKGSIVLDDRSRRVESVYLEIEAASVRSDHPWCDRLARSRRLLHTALYPKIVFKSDKIIHDESGYQVRGVLEMHGIKRRMTFPFEAGIMVDQSTHHRLLDIKGSWNIDRKDFDIVWNKYLDRGGIVVSDIFTVNWGIIAYIK